MDAKYGPSSNQVISIYIVRKIGLDGISLIL